MSNDYNYNPYDYPLSYYEAMYSNQPFGSTPPVLNQGTEPSSYHSYEGEGSYSQSYNDHSSYPMQYSTSSTSQYPPSSSQHYTTASSYPYASHQSYESGGVYSTYGAQSSYRYEADDAAQQETRVLATSLASTNLVPCPFSANGCRVSFQQGSRAGKVPGLKEHLKEFHPHASGGSKSCRHCRYCGKDFKAPTAHQNHENACQHNPRKRN
ncbi:hypothetical protein BJ508DRAFT_327290 [Ascobolus immersus RN42]|uniref:C2H2-type domain-containing protein n=1 Tax=Ascobolus immersus RN42 TaxID=1160509 RepID=A0A3N4I8W8_ASCIM|nr:hypothetical protein BJ508DRAFT_327290 [Ascobolus immersus RN42]